MRKRAQAGLEYLTTYLFLFIAVGIIGAILWKMGVFTPVKKEIVTQKMEYFDIVGFGMAQNKFAIELLNARLGTAAKITRIVITGDINGSKTFDKIVKNGKSGRFIVDLNENCDVGDTYSIEVVVYFKKKIFGSFTTVENADVGRLIVKCHEILPIVRGAWLEGFQYRRLITIDNTANPSSLSDYQIKFTLDTQSLIATGKMRSDCGDIRVTLLDSRTLLDYWIEKGTCNTSNTVVWVKIPEIPANSVKEVYLYYGNPSAASKSNGDDVFIVFDDFSTSTKWSLYACNIDTVNRFMVCSQSGSDYSVLNYRAIPMYNITIEVEWDTTDQDGPNAGVDIGIDTTTGGDTDGSNPGNWYLVAPESGGNYRIYEHSGTTYGNILTTSYTMPINTKIRSKITVISDGTIKYDGSDGFSYTFQDTSPLNDDGGYLAVREWEGRVYLILVRKYTEPEPTVTVGPEETFE